MASLEHQYTDEVFDELGYWGTWLPDESVRVGAVGPFNDHVFVTEGHLEEYEIPVTSEEDPTRSDREYQSKGGVTVTLQGKADAQQIPQVPQGTAGIGIKFSREAGIVFAFKGGRTARMTELERVKHDLISKTQQGSFPDRYAVITQVYVCDALSAVVSQSSKAEFAASASADFKAGLTDLANTSLDVSVKRSNDLAARVLAAEGGTPMFRAIRLKRNFWQDVRVEDLAIPVESTDQDIFDDLTPVNVDVKESSTPG